MRRALPLAMVALFILVFALALHDAQPAPAPWWQVQDCRAALEELTAAQGVVPDQPIECIALTPQQYDDLVHQVARKHHTIDPTRRPTP